MALGGEAREDGVLGEVAVAEVVASNLALGLELDIFNQARDPSKPTWLFGAEVRLSVGDSMHACDSAGLCAAPSDINRNQKHDNDFEGTDVSARQAGVTRGTIGLEGHTILSKRIKYIEPYGGFAALVINMTTGDFGATSLCNDYGLFDCIATDPGIGAGSDRAAKIAGRMPLPCASFNRSTARTSDSLAAAARSDALS